VTEELVDIEYEKKQIVLRKLSETLVMLRKDQSVDVDETIRALGDDLSRLTSAELQEDRYFWNPIRLSELAIQYIEDRRAHPGLPGFSTGFSQLDDGIGGFERENIYMINSRSGMGKTTVLSQFAWHLASQAPVLYFSPEARAKMFSRRLISNLSGVPGWVIRRGTADENQMTLLRAAAKQMKSRPIYFYDLPEVTMKQMELLMNKVYKETGSVPSICILDYLQQMSGNDDFTTITTNMKDIENFTITSNVAMVMASQVGRASGEGDQTAGKGSGKIEELSSVVMGLVRPQRKKDEYVPPDDEFRRWLTITKNREEGTIFKISLIFDRLSGLLKQEGGRG
jgi:replicative DNA helicase